MRSAIGSTAARFSGKYQHGTAGYGTLGRALAVVSVVSAALAATALWFGAAPIAHLRSYFRRGPINDFFPVAVLLAAAAGAGMVLMALDPAAERPSTAGYTLAASLLGLAILEHLFMLVPLPFEKLWRWSTGSAVG